MIKLMMKIKVRFFPTEELLASLTLLDKVDRTKLPNQKLWQDVQMARLVIGGELIRRGVGFW